MINILISKDLGLKTLEEITKHFDNNCVNVLTINDDDDSRSKLKEIKILCNEKNINLSVSSSKKDTHDFLVERNNNITLVVCWYQLILSETLNKLEKPIIGIHNSILPKFRGGSPLVWTILCGEKVFGYSVFEISNGMDEGRLYSQKEFKLESEMSVKNCMDIIEESFISELGNLVGDLKNKVKPTEQVKYGVSFCSQRLPIDGFINWNQENFQIHNFIRSQSHPYPGSYSFLNGKKIIFQKSRLINDRCFGTPGQIFKIEDEGIFIVCSNNSILLVEEIIVNGEIINPNKHIKSVKSRFSKYNVEEVNELYNDFYISRKKEMFN
jgi:methionyl-tRNA formyltransferase